MTAKNLIIVPGAPKSGTTTVFNALAKMSLYTFPLIKEPNYLLNRIDTPFLEKRSIWDLQKYLENLLIIEDYAFDFSQSYFTESLDINKIIELKENIFKNIVLVFILRDPYERIASNYRMDIENGWVNAPLEALLAEELLGVKNSYGAGPRYIEESRYACNIKRLVREISPDAWYVIDSANMADPSSWMFLNIRYKDQFYETLSKKANSAHHARPQLAARLLKHMLSPRFRSNLPSPLKKLVRNLMFSSYDPSISNIVGELDKIETDLSDLAKLVPRLKIYGKEGWSRKGLSGRRT
jgi:hypothetical protein